jgi:tetratricopeptide (TPR) repeat protein
MGSIYFERGEAKRTVELLDKVVQVYRETGEIAAEAAILRNLAVVLHNALGRTEEAIELVARSVAILKQYNLPQDASGASLSQHETWLARMRGSAGAAPPAGGPHAAPPIPAEVMAAVRAFVNAADWPATRRVVEAQQELLLQPEVEALFEQNITQARESGDQRAVGMLELHLDLLRACQAEGIEAAFANLEASQGSDLPFDEELIPRTVAALLSGPQEKMAHAQYLNQQAAQSQDKELKALIEAIQTALFGGHLAELGADLEGVYRQAWEAIVMGVVTEGVDPRVLETIARNTLAVLEEAGDRRAEWREHLASIRQQAEEGGAAQLVALVEAVMGLLDADGDPSGLREGLEGIYAQTWQAIVERMSR